MKNVSYENSQGAVLSLNDGAYFVNANDLRNFRWDYVAANRPSGLGGRMRSFSRPVAERTVNIAIRGTKKQFAARMNALHAHTEVDILSRAPGKLWLGDQYLICYLGIASEIINLSERAHFAEKTLTVAVVEPFWCRDVTQRFLISTESAQEGGKKYDGKYSYKYGSNYQSQTLYNDHYAPCPAVLTIYGPTNAPEIIIGGKTYALTSEIANGERVEIDQIAGTIFKINPDGVRTSIFNERDKEHDIFAFFSPGAQTVSWSGGFNFDVKLIQRRSEPLWT